MSSVRKMRLVPEEELLQKIVLSEAKPEVKAQVRKQIGLEQVLDDSSIPDDVKVKLINEIAQKYKKTTLPDTGATSVSMIKSVVPVMKSKAVLDDYEILRGIPKTYRIKAEQLLKYIKADIRWNSDGEVIKANNDVIPKSNITQLITAAVRRISTSKRPRPPLPGWAYFTKVLLDAGVPPTISPIIYVKPSGRMPDPHTPVRTRGQPKYIRGTPIDWLSM
jgi:hypothetical protein